MSFVRYILAVALLAGIVALFSYDSDKSQKAKVAYGVLCGAYRIAAINSNWIQGYALTEQFDAVRKKTDIALTQCQIEPRKMYDSARLGVSKETEGDFDSALRAVREDLSRNGLTAEQLLK